MPGTYSSDFKDRAVYLVRDLMRNDKSGVELVVISDISLKLGIGRQ